MEEVKPLIGVVTTPLISQLADLSLSALDFPKSIGVPMQLEVQAEAHSPDVSNLSNQPIKIENSDPTTQTAGSPTPPPLTISCESPESLQSSETNAWSVNSNTFEAEISSPPSPFPTPDKHWSEILHSMRRDQTGADTNGSVAEEKSQATADVQSMLKEFGYEFSSSVMSEFLGMVNFVCCPSSQAGAPSASPGSWNGNATNSRQRSQARVKSGKEAQGIDADDDDDNEEDDEEGGEDAHTPTETTSTSRRFACPFYLRNREKHGNIKSCAGPGFTHVYRVW
jgi:hypothetical protein